MIEYKVTVNRYGTIQWYNKTGQLDCAHGPAREYKDGTKFWFKNGKWHNLNGPAVVYSNGSVEYYIEGKRLTEEQFKAATAPVKELTVAELENLLGYKIKVIKG